MKINFRDGFTEDFDSGRIIFHAEVGDKVISCYVADEALHQMGYNNGDRDKNELFQKHRDQVEDLAEDKIRKNQFIDGRIIITTADLNK
ncbi:hypothetical protein THIOSC13_1470003 [uncultured Thiomicrorhabdus sp.]